MRHRHSAGFLFPLSLFCIFTICAFLVVMTGAGATYPYGKDPHNSNIRIAPTYPPLGDLITATELFALCVKLTSAEKLLKDMEQ